MIDTIMDATGITDVWLLACIVLAVLFVIFFILALVNISKKRAANKEVAELKEYITGLEAMTHLPPVKVEHMGSSDSVVFASAKEVRRMEKESAAETGPIAKRAEAAPAAAEKPAGEVSVTAAVHDAILASVTGSHPAIGADGKPAQKPTEPENASLSGRIPKI